MTYRELQEQLGRLTDEQLDCDVTVYFTESDEFLPATGCDSMVHDDVLDENHPYLTVSA